MKTTACKKILVIIIALGGWLTVQSQQYPDSLIKYLEIAAENNPLIGQRFLEYKASLEKIPQAGALSDPEFSAGVFLKPMELVGGKQVADLRLMQMFPWFGVLKNARDEMSLMANAKFELFRDARLQVYFDVQKTWYELYKIRQNISISGKNVETLGMIERLALARFKSSASGSSGKTFYGSDMSSGTEQAGNTVSKGMQAMGGAQVNPAMSLSNQPGIPMQTGSMSSSTGVSGLSDIYRIQIEAAELENNIASLKNREQAITAKFNNLLNRPPRTPVFTPGVLIADSLGLLPETVPDTILANNPMLSMLKLEKQSVEARRKMVKAMGYPMAGLGLNYSLLSRNEMSASSMNGKDMIMPMVSITLPVYRKKYKAMTDEANLLEAATLENYQATLNSLQTEYYQAVQMYQDAGRRIRLFENQYQTASGLFDIMIKSFSASSAELTDLLRVHQQILDYEIKKSEAVADYNIAIAWLKRLMAFYK